jgi:glycerol-3-phosphate dehydrogenase
MLYDVLIVGGGIVGCAIARELTRYNLHVALCEKEAEVGFGTSKANSGIIHGGHHADPRTLKGRLEWQGNRLWDALCTELDFGFCRVGELTVALEAAQLPELDKLLDHAHAQGIPGLERWPRERVLAEEPALNPSLVAAIYAPATGVVNPYEACFALAENAVANGLLLATDSPVTALATDGATWTVTTPQHTFHTRFVVNAAGLYADAVAGLAGVRTFTIQPRKGEEYLLDKRLQGLVHRVIFPCPTPVSKGILVIPTYDGTLMVGPTAHPTADPEDFRTTAEGAVEVFAAVRRIAPGISDKDVIAQFAGLRAAAEGEDFVVGPTARRGFINVGGIQSPGLTAAPALARLVVEMLADEGVALGARDDFVAHRPPPVHFHAMAAEAQVALAARDPAFRRIVCRCEFVTEGEIVAAIERGACTLDGLKFRTRAGMGRCQGGFCTSRCLELLAQRLGLPLPAITKRGGDSWLVRSRAQIQVEELP